MFAITSHKGFNTICTTHSHSKSQGVCRASAAGRPLLCEQPHEGALVLQRSLHVQTVLCHSGQRAAGLLQGLLSRSDLLGHGARAAAAAAAPRVRRAQLRLEVLFPVQTGLHGAIPVPAVAAVSAVRRGAWKNGGETS